MPLDAICLQAVVEELRPQLLGLRIDKVQQPARDQVILLLRGRRLLLNAGANAPRIQLTEIVRDNPAEPPMFCMLLRKHLTGAKIAGLAQPPLERLVRLELYYEPPAAGDRLVVIEETEEGFYEKLSAANPERRIDAFLLDHYFGISPLMARELAFRAAGETDSRLCALKDGAALWREVGSFLSAVRESRFTPVCLRREGRPAEFSCLPVAQYGAAMETETYGSFSQLLDAFYEAREQQERTRQRGADLIRTASTARDRLRRKLSQQEKDYAETQNRDQLRICGDLITANLYRMERGQGRLVCENYYDEAGGEAVIQLDPLLTPQQNKRYTKAKTAERYLREQMAAARRDLEYLESVLEEIGLAETEQDFLDIRSELREAGFLKKQGKKETRQRPAKPREFRTSGGFQVLVGLNNRQNDRLTLKEADHRDIWLHTQKLHGSHVILRTGGQAVGEDDLVEAAKLAAWYSQARESGNVPVDYVQVRYVKKPAGARPGMVVYTGHQTVNVTPEEALVKRLKIR